LAVSVNNSMKMKFAEFFELYENASASAVGASSIAASPLGEHPSLNGDKGKKGQKKTKKVKPTIFVR